MTYLLVNRNFPEEFAKKILCLTKKEECTCKSCIEFESNNNPDFFLLETNENSIKIQKDGTQTATGQVTMN